MNIPIIAIAGPTAVGKTELSIKIAKQFNCEIISIDSVQIYKEFDIGSAKIKKEEMQGVIHHLIDELSPEEKFSVYDFQKLAREKIKDIRSRGKIPLLIGGTGYYMNAVLYNYEFPTYTEKEEISIESMLDYIKLKDIVTYHHIDRHNPRRVVNAYNYLLTENKNLSDNTGAREVYNNYQPLLIILDRNRDNLYQRINRRVALMLEEGLIDEVNHITLKYGKDLQPLNSIGYKEVVAYQGHQINLCHLEETISQNTRRYAKRQLTWFRNKMFNKQIYNLDTLDSEDVIIEAIEKFLREYYENNSYH